MTWGSRQGSSEYLKLLGYKRYHYRWWPHPSGRRFVLLHGRGESADIWTPFASCLAGEGDVIAVDLRGHGGTPWDPDRNYAFAEFVEDLRLQIQHWAVRCVLVGHGLGGHLAVAAASDFPALLDGLVLIEVDPEREAAEALVDRLARRSGIGLESAEAGAFEGPVWRAVSKELTWAKPGGGRRPKCDPAVLAATAKLETESQLGGILTPALVIHGRDSLGVPAPTARRLAKAAPSADYAEVPGGSWPQVDCPQELAEVVVVFSKTLAEVDRQGAGADAPEEP